MPDGPQGSLLEGKSAIAHLLRRAGFGPTGAAWPAWAALDYETALERVLSELDAPQPEDPPGVDVYVPGTIQGLWLERMRAAPAGLAEKLTLFWHGHFATSDAKVLDPQLMWTQYRMLRVKGAGPFNELVLAVSRDVAMVRWLDGNANRRGHANENYARELQELFTLGIGNYTEQDIREIARAFTGWGSRHHAFVFRPEFHDAGEKTIHGQTGAFGGEDVVGLLVAQPACARFLAGKLLRCFCGPSPTEAEVEELSAVLRTTGMDMRKALAHMFRSTAFLDTRNRRALVRSPVEFVIAALRAVDAPEVPPAVADALARMGQVLFAPPSVKGWTAGRGWLSSSAVVERLRAAQRIAQAHPAAAEHVFETALESDGPQGLAERVGALTAEARVAFVLGGPEFQLA